MPWYQSQDLSRCFFSGRKKGNYLENCKVQCKSQIGWLFLLAELQVHFLPVCGVCSGQWEQPWLEDELKKKSSKPGLKCVPGQSWGWPASQGRRVWKAVYTNYSLGFGWKGSFSPRVLLSSRPAAGLDRPLLEGSQASSPKEKGPPVCGGRHCTPRFQAVSLPLSSGMLSLQIVLLGFSYN